MKTKNEIQIPKIAHLKNGWIAWQRVRCGKPNCRCAEGKPHLACYLFTRTRGKLFKRYIKKSQAAAVEREVLNARFARKVERSKRISSVENWRRVRCDVQTAEAATHSLKERQK